jgi:hypothetical protein
VTPGRRDPRPSGFGPMSWLWWPVVMAGWTLAAVVMAAEMVIATPYRPVGRRNGPGSGPGGPSRLSLPYWLPAYPGEGFAPHAKRARE